MAVPASADQVNPPSFASLSRSNRELWLANPFGDPIKPTFTTRPLESQCPMRNLTDNSNTQ